MPLAVTAWLVWSRNISYGYWFVTSQCVAWTLGTLSYYALPTLGPGFEYAWLYSRPRRTPPPPQLMDSLLNVAARRPLGAASSDAVQSVAGFASLHCAITLLVALMVQYTIRSAGCTGLLGQLRRSPSSPRSTSAGTTSPTTSPASLIALISFYVGGIASGQKFDRHGLASHPTTTTSAVPVDAD